MKDICYLCAFNSSAKLSYYHDYFDNFRDLGVTSINLALGNKTLNYLKLFLALKNFRIIIFGYSFFYGFDRRKYLKILKYILKKNNLQRNIFFMENEYRLINKKIDLANYLYCSKITTQLPIKSASLLYHKKFTGKIVEFPHACNSNISCQLKGFDERSIDIGCRTDPYPPYLGDSLRNDFIDLFQSPMFENFKVDIKSGRESRFNREGWLNFLTSCKFTIATEAGSHHVDYDDSLRLKVLDYLKKFPYTCASSINELFFKDIKFPLSGKCISSRHFDAVTTNTCQILLEGHYNGILKPNIHYIEIKKDLSNLSAVKEKMLNSDYCNNIIEQARRDIFKYHTVKLRIENLLKE